MREVRGLQGANARARERAGHLPWRRGGGGGAGRASLGVSVVRAAAGGSERRSLGGARVGSSLSPGRGRAGALGGSAALEGGPSGRLGAFAGSGGRVSRGGVGSGKLGLDLQGGFSVVLQAREVNGELPSEESVEKAKDIIRQRVDGLGVAEPEIVRQGRTVIVQLPGVTDRAKAEQVVGCTAKLEFRPVLAVAPNPDAPAAKDSTTTTTTEKKSTTTTSDGATTTTSGDGEGEGGMGAAGISAGEGAPARPVRSVHHHDHGAAHHHDDPARDHDHGSGHHDHRRRRHHHHGAGRSQQRRRLQPGHRGRRRLRRLG